MAENLVKQESYFTRREWILRYSSPFKSLMFMSMPMIIIVIVNSLYGIIDKQLVLNFASEEVENALKGITTGGYPAIFSPNIAALGLTDDLFAKQLINVSTQYSNTIITIIQALSLFTSVGTSIRFGQAMGARDRDRMNNVIISGFIQTVILIFVSMIALFFVYPIILTSQAGISYGDRTNSWQFALSDEYSRMFVFGIPILLFANFFITLLRTEGKVWIVIFNNVFCVIVNVIFGYIFMDKMGLGMKGAVFGSMVAWAVSIAVSLFVIIFSKDTLLKPNLRKFVWSKHDAVKIWVVGLSPLLTNLVLAIVSFVSTIFITSLHDFSHISNYVQTWMNKGQDAWSTPDPTTMNYLKNYIIIATGDGNGGYHITEHVSNTLRIMSSANPWMSLIYAPIIGMSQGASVNYAYNIGANKRVRIVQIFKIHLLINIIWLAGADILVQFLAKDMMKMFYFDNNNYWWFQLYLAPMIFASLTFTTISFFQGLGNPTNALIVSISRALIVQFIFIIIGYFIAKAASDDGSKDWTFFLMNGLQEIPACIIAGIFLWTTLRKWSLTGELIDEKDNFDAPSIVDVIRYEFQSNKIKKIELLKAKEQHYKSKVTDPEKVRVMEEITAEKIDTFSFIYDVQMTKEIIKLKIVESNKLDKKNFKSAKFETVLAEIECKNAIEKIKKAVIQVQDKIEEKKYAINNYKNNKIIKVYEKDIYSLHKLIFKLNSEISFYQRQEENLQSHYKKMKIYFENHKDEIIKKVFDKENKQAIRKKSYLKKQEENRLRFEERLKQNPDLVKKIESKKIKANEAKEKENESHMRRTQMIQEVLRKREEKRKLKK